MIPEIAKVLYCHFSDCANNVESKCRAFHLEACPMYSGIKATPKKTPGTNGTTALGRDGESHFLPAFQIWAQARGGSMRSLG